MGKLKDAAAAAARDIKKAGKAMLGMSDDEGGAKAKVGELSSDGELENEATKLRQELDEADPGELTCLICDDVYSPPARGLPIHCGCLSADAGAGGRMWLEARRLARGDCVVELRNPFPPPAPGINLLQDK